MSGKSQAAQMCVVTFRLHFLLLLVALCFSFSGLFSVEYDSTAQDPGCFPPISKGSEKELRSPRGEMRRIEFDVVRSPAEVLIFGEGQIGVGRVYLGSR